MPETRLERCGGVRRIDLVLAEANVQLRAAEAQPFRCQRLVAGHLTQHLLDGGALRGSKIRTWWRDGALAGCGRKMRRRDEAAFTEDSGALQCVSQLADIARPAAREQRFAGSVGQSSRGPAGRSPDFVG